MRVFCAALIVASLAGPAYAQQVDDHVQRYGEKAKEKSQGEINQEKAAARAYQDSLKNIPDKGPVDPWGNARSAEAPKTDTKATDAKAGAAKAAKPATKSAAKAAPKPTKTDDTSSQ